MSIALNFFFAIFFTNILCSCILVLVNNMNKKESITKLIKTNTTVTVKEAAIQQRKLFAERLKLARIKSGYTQSQLAEKCDFAPSVIARYEAGGAMPREKTIIILANALGIEANELSGDYENEKESMLSLLRSAGIYFEIDPDDANALYIENAAVAKDLPKKQRIEMAIHITFDDLDNIIDDAQKELQEVTYPLFTRFFFDKIYIFKLNAPYDPKDKMLWKDPNELPPEEQAKIPQNEFYEKDGKLFIKYADKSKPDDEIVGKEGFLVPKRFLSADDSYYTPRLPKNTAPDTPPPSDDSET